MAQTKIYPSTQAQVQAVQNTVDEINAKIVTPKYQAKIVTPTTSQQLIQPDNGYDALSSVTVNAVTAVIDSNIKPENIANNKTILGITGTNGIDLEKFILDTAPESYTLTLHGEIPPYACYGKNKLTNVNFDEVTKINAHAFEYCNNLTNITIKSNVVFNGNQQFGNCRLLETADLRGVLATSQYMFRDCPSLIAVDIRNVETINGHSFENVSPGSGVIFDLTAFSTPPILTNTNAFFAVSPIFIVADETKKNALIAATNWGSFATSQFKTIAGFEQEIGMTYDEYYLQIFGHARNEVQA